MPFCKSCGNKIDENARFCPGCGTPNAQHGGSGEPEVNNTAEINDNFKTVKRSSTGGTGYGSYRLEDLPDGFLIEDRYVVQEKLGQGGFGAVYLVFDKKMEIKKALKVIPDAVSSDEEAMEDLRKEARVMAALNNENIVRVYDFHDKGSIKYIDMEYVEGKTLAKLKLENEERKLDEVSVKNLALQIARGLSYAHSVNVIHKDIKPQNVMVAANGRVKIMDFGIAETVRTSMSRIHNTSSSGTLVYMSPEQIRGEDVGRESDIYSFGAMLYELLSGHPPFYKGALEYQILNETVTPIDGISSEMNAVLSGCLLKNHEERFPDFNTVLASLNGEDVSEYVGNYRAEKKIDNNLEKADKTIPDNGIPSKKGKKILKAAVLAGMFAIFFLLFSNFIMPRFSSNIYSTQITELNKNEDTLVVELENIVDKVIKEEKGLKTIKGLKYFLDKKPGNVVVLSGLSLIYQRIGEYDEELDTLNIIKTNASKGVHVPEVLGFLVKRRIELSDIREELKKDTDNNNWIAVKQLLDKNSTSGLLEKEYIADTLKTVNKSLLIHFISEGLWKNADNLVNECRKNKILKNTVLEKAVKDLNIGIEKQCVELIEVKEFSFIKGLLTTWSGLDNINPEMYSKMLEKVKKEAALDLEQGIEKSLAEKDWIKVLDLLVIAEEDALLENDYIAEHRAIAEKNKKQEDLAAARKKASADKRAAEERARTKRIKAAVLNVENNMVYVKGGSFQMGSNAGRSFEKTNNVTLSSFYISSYEMIQKVYKTINGNNPSSSKKGIGDNYPVTIVNWYDAVKFCNELSRNAGLTPVYRINGVSVSCNWNANGYRLPTEAEWEFAARGGNKSIGYSYAGNNIISVVAWYKNNSGDKTHTVGLKRSNELGLYDMIGNVSEWCWDWYEDYRGISVADPRGPKYGTERVLKGGAHNYEDFLSINRNKEKPDTHFTNVGFRVVRRY